MLEIQQTTLRRLRAAEAAFCAEEAEASKQMLPHRNDGMIAVTTTMIAAAMASVNVQRGPSS